MYLNDLYSSLPQHIISHEAFVKLNDFYNAIINSEYLQCISSIIVPYYIFEGKIYEFYWYELHIEDGNIDFVTWIENKIKKDITDINLEMIEHNKNCFISISGNLVDKKRIKVYLEYVQNSLEIKDNVNLLFGEYDKENLYIQLY